MASSHDFKLEYQSIIKFLCKEESSVKEIHSRMVNVTVTQWFCEFKRGRVHVEDDPRAGRLTTSTDLDNSASAESLIMNNRRIKVSKVEN